MIRFTPQRRSEIARHLMLVHQLDQQRQRIENARRALPAGLRQKAPMKFLASEPRPDKVRAALGSGRELTFDTNRPGKVRGSN